MTKDPDIERTSIDILANAPLPNRLQALIEKFHRDNPDYSGPVVYVLETGYAKISHELFARVTWPHPDSLVYLITDHTQIKWAMWPPFMVFQAGYKYVQVPATHVRATERLPYSQGTIKILLENLKSLSIKANFSSLASVSEKAFRLFGSSKENDFLKPVTLYGMHRRKALAMISNFNAGGAERQASIAIRGLAKELNDRARDLHVLTYAPGGPPPHEQFFGRQLDVPAEQVHDILACDSVRAPYQIAQDIGKPLAWGAALEERLGRALDRVDINTVPIIEQFFWTLVRIRPEVVVCWQDYMNTIGGYAACLAGAQKVILFCRNVAPDMMGFHQPFFKSFYRNLLDTDRVEIWCNSRAGAETYAEWLECPVERIQIVYNAFVPQADADVEDSASIRSTGPPTIIGVFKLRIEKDPSLFIRVVQLIKKEIPDVRVLHLGDGPLQDMFKAEIADAGLDGTIFPLGLRNDVDYWLQQADLMLHTALTEGLPNVFLEAQHRGVPIVTTKAGGTSEAMVPGETGDELDSRNPEILAEMVIRRLRDSDWRANARKLGPTFVADRFSEPRYVEELLRRLK